MIFRIAVCSADASLRAALQRLCMEYFARRAATSCVVEQLDGAPALLERDAAGARYELYLLDLAAAGVMPPNPPSGLAAAMELRRRGRREPLAFLARTTAYAYNAYRVDAMQYFMLPLRQEDFFAFLRRAVEPEYGPMLAVTTAAGTRSVAYSEIEYLECTHHVVHFHLTNGEDVVSLSLRVSFAQMAAPLLADGRFFQPHRSYVINLAAAHQLHPGELFMRSGARIPIPRGRESSLRAAFKAWLDRGG